MAGVIIAILLVGFGHVPVLRAIGAILIVEDRLEPAAAIVALGGGSPFREIEAAQLYHAGWAPRVVIVQGARRDESKALEDMGISTREAWEVSREVLIRQRVPAAAIVILKNKAADTLEELQAVGRALHPDDSRVILVTSKYHTRRTQLTWRYASAGRSRAIVRSARDDRFDPHRWWRERSFALSVVREYLGLMNYYTGFPVGVGR